MFQHNGDMHWHGHSTVRVLRGCITHLEGLRSAVERHRPRAISARALLQQYQPAADIYIRLLLGDEEPDPFQALFETVDDCINLCEVALHLCPVPNEVRNDEAVRAVREQDRARRWMETVFIEPATRAATAGTAHNSETAWLEVHLKSFLHPESPVPASSLTSSD